MMNKLKCVLAFRSFTTSVKRCEGTPVVSVQSVPKPEQQTKNKIDGETIALLERLSLVDCANKESIETLEAAIDFADQILEVDVTNVEPLVTVLEDIPLSVREDQVTEGNCKQEILSNASVTEDGYFVTPPGNIVIEPRENLLYDEDK